VSFLDRITETSWADPGIDDARHSHRFSARPVKRVGLVMFLAVVTSLFFLFFVAYIERMELGDWFPVGEPRILWLNTGLLVLASMFMQRARNLAAADTPGRTALWLSGLLVIAFLAGQLVAWQQLAQLGVYSMANPGYAFFYLLTALHGIHLIGGLYVWVRAMVHSRHAGPADLAPTLELCAIYWHYLLLLWVVLFVLMLNT
jgi:cytochrome c oxidase subunit 3